MGLGHKSHFKLMVAIFQAYGELVCIGQAANFGGQAFEFVLRPGSKILNGRRVIDEFARAKDGNQQVI